MPAVVVPPLTASHRQQFLDQGYLYVADVVPRAECERVIAAICAFSGVDPNEEHTWRDYPGHGIIPLHHHQALWNLRQLPQIHELFALLLGTEQLWVTLDRVSFKAPAHTRTTPFRMDAVHWDGDPRGTELGIQGLVYLTDNPPAQGAFAMAPALYQEIDTWLATPRSATQLRRPDVSDYPLVPVGGAQGSMVLWHRRMPHTSLANNPTRPRYVQYVAMSPAGDEAARAEFATFTRERRPPAWAVRQRVPGQLDPEPGPPLELSELGKKLAGLASW